MNSYEIKITDLGDYVNMSEIQSALYATGIADGGDSEAGVYLRDGKPNSVFVSPSDVSAAVVIINELGFTTDENTVVERVVECGGLEDRPTVDGQAYDIIATIAKRHYTLDTISEFVQAYREGVRFHMPFSDQTDTLRVMGIKPRTIDINPAIMPQVRAFLLKMHDYDVTRNGLDYVRLFALAYHPDAVGGIVAGPTRRAMNYHAENMRLSCDVPYSFKVRKSQDGLWRYLVANPGELTRLGHKMFRACVKWDSEFTADLDGAVMAYGLARQVNKRARQGKD